MIAQYYNDSDEVVRIFHGDDPQAIMDCLMFENSIREADLALRRCRLRRKEKWRKRDWGYETRISWK